MKLLLCYDCYDVKKLGRTWTKCRCGQVRARYVDSLHAVWNGHGQLLGINNRSLGEALHLNRDAPRSDGLGHRFEAFVIPVSAPTVKIISKAVKKK